ncbi:MAG: PhoH family protein [Eggerthella sp.]|nr:PhoH family protein [Eggerthella sp.]
MQKEVTQSINLNDPLLLGNLLGPNDENLRFIQDSFQARITVRGSQIEIEGSPIEVDSITTLISDMLADIDQGVEPDVESIKRSLALLHEGEYAPKELHDDVVLSYKGRVIRPKTPMQKEYLDYIRTKTITFGMGPAGTGKTYLAMAMAVAALNRKEVGRILLTRPVVEAGENLGFLPGTLTEKIDPYIRPLYDALFDMMDPVHANKLLAEGVIEIAPLAFMRGRTLNDSFIILDEAQNTTSQQMKMFITRLGMGSKMVITGDMTQTDLPKGISGLQTVRQVLEGIDEIGFIEFQTRDVVRNSLVSKIIAAYARAEANNLRL